MVTPPLIGMGAVFAVGVLLFGSAMGLFAVGGFVGQRPGRTGAMVGGALLFLVFFGVVTLINLASSAVVVVMAGDVLGGRKPSLATGYAAVLARLADVVVAAVLCGVIIGVASLLLIIPGLIAAFFLIFTLPAVLLDGAGPIESLRKSATLVRENLGRVAGLVVGTVVASVVVWVASMVLHIAPVIGHLAGMLLTGALFAYLTIVAVRVYHTLTLR